MQNFEQLVRLAKSLSQDLGRTPLRLEIQNAGASNYAIQKHGYNAIIRAAGLEENALQAKHIKTTNEVFHQNIDDIIENYEPKKINKDTVKSHFLVIGDTHFPFIHQHTLDKALAYNQKHKPDYIIQVGDLYDMYAHSKFPRSQNIYKPQDEEVLGRQMAEAMFTQLREDNPKAKMHNLMGNHDVRPVKRALETHAPFEHIVQKHITELMTFEGVTLVPDVRDILVLEGIGFTHGHYSQLGQHRDAFLGNIVVGHTHRGGTVFRQVRDQMIWELNAGFMGDPESKVMSYTPSKLNNYTLGFGAIDPYGPRFIV